jgi:hypothetical protein
MKLIYLATILLTIVSCELSEQQERELVVNIDKNLASTRGVIQGLKRGFYQEYTFEIKPNCFGETTEVLMFNFYEIYVY